MKQPTVRKEFIRYVSINCLGMLGLSCYILADTYYVSLALGTAGLAALNISISVFSIIQGLGLLLGIGGATRFTIKKAKKEHNDAFTLTLYLWAILSVVLVCIGIWGTERIASLLGADATTLPLATTYMATLLCFSPLFLLNNIMLAFVRNDRNPALPMIAMIVSSLSNIILDYVFMFPLGMGIFGAALATCIAPFISLCLLSLHIIRRKNTFRPERISIKPTAVRNIGALGFSAMIAEFASATTLIVFNLAAYRNAGNTGVAAYGIVANIALIVTAIFVGVSQGTQPLASNACGTGAAGILKQLKRYTITTTLLLAAISYLAIFLLAGPIVAAFNSEGNATLAALAIDGTRIYFLGYFFAGINIIAAAFLSAIGNTKAAFTIAILRSIMLIIPIALLLSTLLGMTGIWLSFVLTEGIVFFLSLWNLKK